MAEPAAEALLVVGRITGPYGIRGWVKVHPYTETPERFLTFGHWQLKRRQGLEPVVFDQGRTHGKGLVAHIEGVDDRTLAERYAGLEVVVPEQLLPPPPEGDYYWRQLEGLAVWCREDGGEPVLLGTVDHLIETGANDVLVVTPGPDSDDQHERLIPYLPGKTVSGVDLARGVIEVDWFLRDE